MMAYIIRPIATTKETKKYFIPVLLVKMFGAIAVGLIYHFYYDGGDTFNFFEGSEYVHRALLEKPLVGLKLLFSGSELEAQTFEFARNIRYRTEPSAFLIVKIAGIIDLFTFHTYSATALFFAVFSFSGQWALYRTYTRLFGRTDIYLTLIILLVPSMIFWGSGLLKDTITIGALGWTVHFLYKIFYFREFNLKNFILLLLFGYITLLVKAYIIIILLGTIAIWLYSINVQLIKDRLIRYSLGPIMILLYALMMYYATAVLTAGDLRYSLDGIAERARINAYDIYYRASAEGASSYYLGQLDGTFTGMLSLFPAAVNVSLFRPYFWEANNVLMLISSFESFLILVATILILLFRFKNFFRVLGNPHFRFCIFFSISFAFGVGVSTYNFGSLVRYKIPLLPFYLLALYIIWNRERNVKRSV
ncbi:MAG: hypothetical protein RIM99_16880 [Cyclobacteriaceae bacterium]